MVVNVTNKFKFKKLICHPKEKEQTTIPTSEKFIAKRKCSQSIHDIPPHNHRDVRCKYKNHPQFQSVNMNNQRVP